MVLDVNDEYVFAGGGRCYSSWTIFNDALDKVRCPTCDKICKGVDSYKSHYATVHVPY